MFQKSLNHASLVGFTKSKLYFRMYVQENTLVGCRNIQNERMYGTFLFTCTSEYKDRNSLLFPTGLLSLQRSKFFLVNTFPP